MVTWIICQPISPQLHVYKPTSQTSRSSEHNTLHNIIYLLPYTAYSYEPGLIRYLPTYLSTTTNMLKNTVTTDLVLDGQSNWELWIFVVKRIAEAGDVWEYIDPDQLNRLLQKPEKPV
jgi:hypothetical protein